jgi:iron complex outermembrane receptor protein
MYKNNLVLTHAFRRSALYIAIAGSFLAPAPLALGQSNLMIEEITVTARKRSESLQDVPIAISAFTGDMLEAKGATNIEQISRHVPNLNISFGNSGSGSAANTSIYLRGVGQIDFLLTTDPGVGLYIDNVYFARAQGTNMDLVDLETIEVLRGPQGTLFGKNTIGGAVVLTSTRPNEEFGGRMQLTVGDYNRVEGKASVDIPINDKLLSRFTGIAKTRDGYADRRIGGRLGDEEVLGGRATFEYTPSEQGSFTLILDSITRDATSAVTAAYSYDPAAPLAGLWTALVAPSVGVDQPVVVNRNDPFNSDATGPNVDDVDSWGGSFTANWDFQAFSLKSVTAYREMDTEFARDGDNSPAQYIETHNTGSQDQFSQEFQFLGTAFDDRLDWVVGAYYFEETANDQNDVRLASGLYNALESLPAQLSGTPCGDPWIAPGCEGNPINIGLDLDFDVQNKVENESVALFFHGTYALTESLNLTGGLRYLKEEKEYELFHDRVNAGVPIIPLTTVKDDWNQALPLLTLDYRLNDGSMVYASISEGFKSGGFNGRPTTTAAVDSFDPESVISYELGYKADLAQGKVRLNTAVFLYDYQDIQLSSNRADSTGNLVLVTENGGTATIQGLELDLTIRPTERWDIVAGIGYLDAQYDDLNEGVSIGKNDDLPYTPDFTGNLGVAYSLPLFGSYMMTIRTDLSYQASHYVDVENSEDIKQGDLTLVNARMTVASDNEKWQLAIFATNLTDEEYQVAGLATSDSFGHAEASIGAPVEWGASLNYRF